MLLISNFYPVLQQPRVGLKTRGLGFFFLPFCVLGSNPGTSRHWTSDARIAKALEAPLWWCGCSVAKLWTHGLQHTGLPCPSLSPRVCTNSCPLSRWCHPTISSSVVPFFSCPQSFPASGMMWRYMQGGITLHCQLSTPTSTLTQRKYHHLPDHSTYWGKTGIWH